MSVPTPYRPLSTSDWAFLTPADRRFVYFPVKDPHDLLFSKGGELNVLLLFNMVAAGNVPPASRQQYVPLR
jgi:hypothetical protein